MSGAERIALLEQQERELVLPAFDNAAAYRLGSRIARIAEVRGLRVAIDIRRPGLILYRAAFDGITADQEHWIARKAALVQRMEASGALVEARFDGFDPSSIGWLGHEYAITAGAFPLRVRGAGLVAVATASGLSSQEDHDLVVEGIRAHLSEEEAT
ncbi:heme-degrading domain-containing protein [Microbacterium sp. NPDC055683]